MAAQLLLLFLCMAVGTAARPLLRSAQEIRSIPLKLQAIVAPPPSSPQDDHDARVAQCLVASFRSLHQPAREGESLMILSTTKVLGKEPTHDLDLPTAPPSIYSSRKDDNTLSQFRDDDDQDTFLLPPDERDDESLDLAFLQAIADWIHSFLVHLGVLDPSSSVAASRSTDSASNTEDLGCVMCPNDDDDGGLQSLLDTTPPAVTPTAAPSNLGCDLCPDGWDDDDDDYSYFQRGDGTVVHFEQKQGNNRRLHNRAMWTVQGLLESQALDRSETTTETNLWNKFETETDPFAWADLFCECFNGDNGVNGLVSTPRDSSFISICQIHVNKGV